MKAERERGGGEIYKREIEKGEKEREKGERRGGRKRDRQKGRKTKGWLWGSTLNRNTPRPTTPALSIIVTCIVTEWCW